MILRSKATNTPGVLLAAAECAPLAKTGGLADVVGTLPKSLAALGFDARIITPYHRVIKEKYAAQVTHLTDFYIDLGWRHQYVGIERLLLDGIVIYLVDNEFYFGDRIYLGGEAEGEQYAFFARAILEALPRLDFTPEILHCNDWHTAVLPMLMKTQYAGRMQSRMQTLLTILEFLGTGLVHGVALAGCFVLILLSQILVLGHHLIVICLESVAHRFHLGVGFFGFRHQGDQGCHIDMSQFCLCHSRIYSQ